ncbi:Permease of the drug/metabolite transporter (DMT) superfamily [Halanaerobium congolense]|jgi:drug/metabolite transporter (DMT)-like permease|uniref:Permease of the drug/metabolite transporter (DMT) superfamily n=1 Tax=Halanaerobium congolense TaxID=54121 RepID=A0A1M7MB45_9FIRM|nr:DMT family transporter [Halanaerobium congolense]SDI77540.1 Permease of the drug/metabolite transporter (DMT) superfamily [Halanaerobium congolense]SET46068.1 Permease of the drug/metabolite transporter (DMT) superfamily [Halanaerobium congolense]SHM87966.1 Permease of the drug/metabolite transporter (DMT) superfamily [Halanaerobium congolense]
MDYKKKINILLAVGIFFLSTSGILIKVASAPPLITAFYRMFFTVLILTPYFLIKHRADARYFLDYRPLLVGFLLAVHFILWISSIQYTDISNSVIFVALQPLFTIILEYLFAREDLKEGAVIGIVMAVIGSSIISIGDFYQLGDKLFGNFLALSAALFASSYLFIGRGVRKKLNYFPYLYILYTYAALFLAVGVYIFEIPFTGYGTNNYLIFLALALGPTIVGHSILNLAVRYLPTSIVSLSILGEPILTTFLAWLLLSEEIRMTTMFGGAFILGGIYLASVYNNHQNRKKERLQQSES